MPDPNHDAPPPMLRKGDDDPLPADVDPRFAALETPAWMRRRKQHPLLDPWPAPPTRPTEEPAPDPPPMYG